MPLRCLLFSSHEEMVQPIWQVLADLGIEGEYCQNAVDAVERVTTQLFQIVITDWDDQPEAGFLLKTARDLKAAQRPLTLAIVSDDARLPEALRAGANSVLQKPIRAEQVRDTMSTACELLRSKLQPTAPAAPRGAPETAAMAAAASTGAVSVAAAATQAPEKMRAGEVLQSSSSAPRAQFDTESEVEPVEEPTVPEVDALTELEPAAASGDTVAAEPKPQEPLTGWAMLQARLTRKETQTADDAPAKSELLSYGETPSYGSPAAAAPAKEGKASANEQSQQEAESEAALFAYMPGESKASSEPAEQAPPKRSKIFLAGALAVACVILVAVPRTRQALRTVYGNAARAGGRWLNPPPAPLPQAVAQHDSFGQSGDEYNLPVPGNIPDATTDPSQIRVLPVVDPTAKPDKGSEANGGQGQATTGENPTDQNQTAPSQSTLVQVNENQGKDPATTPVGDVPGNPAVAVPGPAPSQTPVQPNAPAAQAAVPQPPVALPVRSPAPSHAVSAGPSAGIPSSLKSQIASSTPESSGAKPVEAAMSSIEPVNLPESAVRELLAQPVDPEYPAAAKASGQRGSVVLQVLIGRDGAVQEAKFLQGSLVFARAAIDAVKQWRFKPYSMNGRTVSVQSVVTLAFKPPS
jgi:periplasmic protein TonB